MSKFAVSHEINCSINTFWEIFLDTPFNESLYREALNYQDFQILEQRKTDTESILRWSGKPNWNLPSQLTKLLGSGYTHTLDGRLDHRSNVWTFRLTPSYLSDKIRIEVAVRLEPLGDNKVRLIVEIVTEVKIFGIGGLLESTYEKSFRQEWDQSAVFMNAWIAEKKAS